MDGLPSAVLLLNRVVVCLLVMLQDGAYLHIRLLCPLVIRGKHGGFSATQLVQVAVESELASIRF